MNKKIRRLKAYVQTNLPYHVYQVTSLVFFIAFIAVSIVAVALTFVEVPSIPYDETNTNDYMYLRIIDVYPTAHHYYFLEDDDYIYIYYNDKDVDLNRLKQVEGVPIRIEDQMLEKMLIDFQGYFPDLEVTSVEEMVEYTGYYALDATAPPLAFQSGIMIIIACLCLFISLFILICLKINDFRYRSSLKNIVIYQEQERVIQQLMQPIYKYISLRVALLDDYLVFNHPSPFVIKYDDIKWIYIEKYFFSKELRIVLYDRNYKKHCVLFTKSFVKKNKAEIIELFDVLPIIHPEILIGYNDNNKMKFQQLKKTISLKE